MRAAIAVPVLLAACLVATAAFAANTNTKITAQFSSLAASGVVGDVTLNPMPDGEIQFHSQLKGLAPGQQYAVFVYDSSTSCGAGTPVQIETFTANNAGIANWNTKAALALTSVQSIGIQQASSTSLVACAGVPQ